MSSPRGGTHSFPRTASGSPLVARSAVATASRYSEALDTLILNMLTLEPEARPTADEVARRLESLAHPAAGSRGRLWVAAAVAALASAVFGVVWIEKQEVRKPAPASLAAVPMTATAGFDSWPDISPDGNTVVYGWGDSPDGYTAIYLKEFDQDSSVKLLEAEPGRIGHPKWSPDGRRVYYKRTSPRLGETIRSVARDGTDPRIVVNLTTAELSSGFDFSADGKRIIYSDRIAHVWRFGIRSLDLASGQVTVLTSPSEGWGDWDPQYSPDGKNIAFKRREGAWPRSALYHAGRRRTSAAT